MPRKPSALHRLIPGLLALAFAVPGCRSAGSARSPEALRDAYAQALRRDDPDAAYALLSPELQAATPRAAFRARWQAQTAERTAAQAALAALPPAQRAAIAGGQTTHGALVLTWAEVAGHYQIVAGLPGLPDSSTPAQAIRAFLAAVRGADLRDLEALVSDELAARLRDDWGRRAALIEALLDQPGAIEYSSDMQRAVLRYEPGRALTLEQSPAGWRLTALQ
ncbi:MAG: hypothetical protein IPO88_28080 [Nannocystis sp.]|uniref:hypothetical protein n=1 Tax=Nannocystis sp. TaxID=1962667 RepID=UPI002426E537|nr:hypothetical protein [Nannocystis sp.]MBK9757288.1 hypothetical protein [Nannocystis sp.]